MKNFITDLRPKKMDLEELMDAIADNQNDLVEFYMKHGFKAKHAETINILYSKMLSTKFVKALRKVAKNGEDGPWTGLNPGFIMIINGFIERNHKNEGMTEELLEAYTEIINKVLKKKIKNISESVGIDKDIIKEMLVVVPDKGCIDNERSVGFYCQKMLRKMYILAADRDLGLTDTDKIKAMFKNLFGKKLLDVIAVYVLLEKKEFMKNFNESQTALWNLMTEFALETFEKQDKEHITELIEYYCSCRKFDFGRNRDSARRISLNHIDAEAYPKTAKRAAKFTKKGKENLTKFM